MKKKIVISCAAMLLAASVLQAQSGAVIKGGLNFTNVSINENGRVDDANMLTSFQIGLHGDVALGKLLSFQPGLVFSGKGSKVQRGEVNQSDYYKQTFNPYYIEVPANLVLKVPVAATTRFFVGGGPYMAVGVSGKVKTDGRTILGTSYSEERKVVFSDDDPTTLGEEEGAGFGVIKRFDYGLNGTAGIEGKGILVGVNYGLGLAKLQSGSNSNVDHNNKHRVFSIVVGFRL